MRTFEKGTQSRARRGHATGSRHTLFASLDPVSCPLLLARMWGEPPPHPPYPHQNTKYSQNMLKTPHIPAGVRQRRWNRPKVSSCPLRPHPASPSPPPQADGGAGVAGCGLRGHAKTAKVGQSSNSCRKSAKPHIILMGKRYIRAPGGRGNPGLGHRA